MELQDRDGADLIEDLAKRLRKQALGDAGAVERRDRQQVEQAEQHVQVDEHRQRHGEAIHQ